MKWIKDLIQKIKNWKGDLLWLCHEAKGTVRYMLGFLLISLIGMAFSLISPYISKLIVDAVSGANPHFSMGLVYLMLGTSLLSILFSTASTIFSSYVNEKFAFSLRARMFDRTQRGRWLNISRFHSGDMMARLNADVDTIASNIITILPNLIVSVLQLVIILVIVFSVDPVLALIGLIAGPAGVMITLVFRKPMMKYQGLFRESHSEYYTFLQEKLSNLGVIKSFQLEQHNNDAFEDIRQKRLKIVLKNSCVGAAASVSSRAVYTLAYVSAFAWCAHQLEQGAYSYGTMTMFLTQVSQIQSAIRNVGYVLPTLFTTIVSTRRVREITEQGAEDTSAKDKDTPSNVGLSAYHINFTYDNETVLKDISFDIRPNAHVGIIGPSGVGKTTLIRLLLALTEPDGGTLEYVFLDGTRETVSPGSRRLLSYVPQGNTLMTGTVRYNLLTGNPDATEDMMWRALEMADAADFVRKDPNGLDLVVTERSGGLSAGQAQRICIARALLRNRPVLIFDEATSALDERTERRIFETLVSESDKTCFIITHRSSMLRYCDTVMEVHEDGSITVWEQAAPDAY